MATRYRVRTVFRALSFNDVPLVVDIKCWRVTLLIAPSVDGFTINGAEFGSLFKSATSASSVVFGGAFCGEPVPYVDTWTFRAAPGAPVQPEFLTLVLEYMDPE